MFLTAEDAEGKLVNPSDEVLRDGMPFGLFSQ
jgi:hypothetical protein